MYEIQMENKNLKSNFDDNNEVKGENKSKALSAMICDICNQSGALWLCNMCPKNKLYCDECWTFSHRKDPASSHNKEELTEKFFALCCSDHSQMCIEDKKPTAYESKSDVELERLWIEGFCLEKEESVEELKRYASYGNHMARVLVGGTTIEGSKYFLKNEDLGVEMLASEMAWLQEQAKEGNVVAQSQLGFCHQYGRGIEKDMTEAVRWYLCAANQGSAHGQLSLGYCYGVGVGVEQNKEEGFRYYGLAAAQGYTIAQFLLAVCCENGDGTTKNMEEAIRWYELAAAQGFSHAKTKLEEIRRNK